jgi:riboflavin kinase/FMN adenylyltransferase
MKLLEWSDFIARKVAINGAVALTIGVFDGIHIGHKKLLGVIREAAGNDPGRDVQDERPIPLLVTFRQNPLSVLGTRRYPGNILSSAQKLEKLEECGIHHVLMIDFSHDFSKIAGEKFIETLAEGFSIIKMAVGYNFALGHGRGVDARRLPAILPDVEIEVIQPVYFEGDIVSSTRIRNSISAGRFVEANTMLEGSYSIEIPEETAISIVDRGFAIERRKIEQVVPQNGRYHVKIDLGEDWYDVACDVGDRYITVETGLDSGNYSSIKNIIFAEN